MNKFIVSVFTLFFLFSVETRAIQVYYPLDGTGVTWNGNVIPISKGGTGATTAAGARTNLGLGSVATQNSDAISLTGGTIAGMTSIGGTTGTFTGTVNATGGFVGVIGSSITQNNAQFFMPVNAQTTTNYTLTTDDCGKMITLSNASATTLNLPQQSTASTNAGFWCHVRNLGAGAVTVVKQGSDTLDGNTSILQYGEAVIERPTTTKWTVFGGNATVNMPGMATLIQVVGNNTYLAFHAGCSGTILGVYELARAITTPGTFLIAKNGVTITGLSAIVPTTGGSYTAASALNTFVRGDNFAIVYSGTTAVLDHTVVLDYTMSF